jgi:chorismate-pyruvate lyase
MRGWFWAALAWVSLATPPTASALSPAEARTLIAELNTDLLTHDSATATLQRWCAARHLADPPRIVAERALGPDKPADAEVRRLLHAAPGEPIRYRRVALACGAHVLSNADNWYRPGRLTAAMNAELDATDHPFGAVVKPLGFHRVTLSAEVLLPPAAHAIPSDVIRHRAVLETADGEPFSLVIETYTAHVLDGD